MTLTKQRRNTGNKNSELRKIQTNYYQMMKHKRMQVTLMVRAVSRVHLALVIISQRREGLQQRKVNSIFFINIIASKNVMHCAVHYLLHLLIKY
jgi:hypothetical protein